MKIKKLETFTKPFVSFVKTTLEDGSVGFGQMSTYHADITAQIFHKQVAPWILNKSWEDFDDIENLVLEKEHKFPGSYLLRAIAGLDSNNLNGEPFGSAAGAAAMSATTLVEYTNHYEKNDVVVQIDNIMDLPGGSVQALVGFETFENRYSAEYDKHSENGLVGGSAGNSGAGLREVDSVFGEILFPVMDNLEVTASFRSDDYSDVGESDSFKLGALWVPVPGTIVKLNTGEGFRAPTMDNLYGATTVSYTQLTLPTKA